jgi:c(7)-type cytochrome triheme protein
MKSGVLRRGIGSLARAASVLGLLLAMSSGGSAMDRSELAKVLKTIPPNGPFARYGNVTMRTRAKQAGMDPVIFPHWVHRARYTCRVCHLELNFGMKRGDTGITRAQYVKGKFCGVCHNGETAFGVQAADAQCHRCHMKDAKELDKRFEEFSEGLPLASFGNGIDWATAYNDGSIRPINSIKDEISVPFPEKLKQPLKLGSASPRSDVNFSHKDHFAELDCSSCHPDIFNIKLKSTVAFTMDTNIYGNFCGACHMLVAFPMNDCKRCHKGMSNSSGY